MPISTVMLLLDPEEISLSPIFAFPFGDIPTLEFPPSTETVTSASPSFSTFSPAVPNEISLPLGIFTAPSVSFIPEPSMRILVPSCADTYPAPSISATPSLGMVTVSVLAAQFIPTAMLIPSESEEFFIAFPFSPRIDAPFSSTLVPLISTSSPVLTEIVESPHLTDPPTSRIFPLLSMANVAPVPDASYSSSSILTLLPSEGMMISVESSAIVPDRTVILSFEESEGFATLLPPAVQMESPSFRIADPLAIVTFPSVPIANSASDEPAV